MIEDRAEAKKFGVDETEYTLWQLAKEMVNDEKSALNAGEKAEIISMLDVGNSEIAYFYSTKLGDKAYENGIDMENYAMFKGAIRELENSEDWEYYSKEQKKQAKDDAADMYADNDKEFLYFMATEYSSYKKRSDYIDYFGKEE